jgi:hypothetical protein
VAHEVGHLPARDPRRAPRRRARPVGAAISCGNAIPSRRPERVTAWRRRARTRELVAVDRRRVDVDPADAEADPGGRSRSDSVSGIASPSRAITIPFISVPSTKLLEDRTPARPTRERLVQVRVEVVERLDPEDAALAARVGGLQHRREARPRRRRSPSRQRRAPRRSAAAARPPRRVPPHRDLVRHPVRDVSDADPGRPSASATAATTGTARSADTVSAPSIRRGAGDLGDRVDVGEVDDLGDVRLARARRVRVAVDRDDAQPSLLRLQRSRGAGGGRRRRRGRSSRAGRDLAAALLTVLLGDFRHAVTLRKRTDVLYYS